MLTYSIKHRFLYLALILFVLLLCSVAPAATIEFYRDAVSKPIKVDTVVPANTNALPVLMFNSLGEQVNLSTEATLAALSAKIPVNGQALMAASIPVVLASDQSVLAVSSTNLDIRDLTSASDSVAAVQSGTWNINNISGIISLPTGAATNASVQAIETQIEESVGLPNNVAETDELASASLIAFAKGIVALLNSMINTTLASIDTSASAINGKLPATLGQKTGANSLAVVMASDFIPAQPAVSAAVTVKQAAVTVGTSAVRITHDGSAPSATRRRLNFMLDPSSSATCYYGSATVTSSGATRGVVFFPGAAQEWVDDANDYYAICSVAAQTVFVTEAE